MNEQKKIILSLIFAFIIQWIICYFTKIPEEISKNLNLALKTKDKKLIKRKL
jgi:hypothetical protein